MATGRFGKRAKNLRAVYDTYLNLNTLGQVENKEASPKDEYDNYPIVKDYENFYDKITTYIKTNYL